MARPRFGEVSLLTTLFYQNSKVGGNLKMRETHPRVRPPSNSIVPPFATTLPSPPLVHDSMEKDHIARGIGNGSRGLIATSHDGILSSSANSVHVDSQSKLPAAGAATPTLPLLRSSKRKW